MSYDIPWKVGHLSFLHFRAVLCDAELTLHYIHSCILISFASPVPFAMKTPRDTRENKSAGYMTMTTGNIGVTVG